jgi:hypothetical protein
VHRPEGVLPRRRQRQPRRGDRRGAERGPFLDDQRDPPGVRLGEQEIAEHPAIGAAVVGEEDRRDRARADARIGAVGEERGAGIADRGRRLARQRPEAESRS